MSAPELSVVCRSCGSEVSPYVTECPYCGTRVRKRAPKLERKGDELQAREPRRQRRRRERAERARDRQGISVSERLEGRPWAVIAAVAAPILVMLTERATNLGIVDFGAIVGSVGAGEWWRYLAAPWVYPDVGYMLVAAIGIVIFGLAVERRLGTVPTLLLMIASGALGMLAADGIEGAIGSDGEVLLAAGGNGVALGLLACWAVLKSRELRSEPADVDVIGAGVCAIVLILLPVADDFANVFAGLAGGVVGAACGFVAAFARRERPHLLTVDKFIRLTPELHRYVVEHNSFRGDVAEQVEAAALEMGDLSEMQIGGDQAAMMTVLVSAIGARRALEVGTFLGYGAIAIARGLPADGRLVCCELDAGYAERAEGHLEAAGFADRAEIRVGPALETLAAMDGEEPFDFAFIDADKTEYVDYFEAVLALLRPGGLIMLDNTLRLGTVLDPDTDAARVTAQLNDSLVTDDRVDAAMIAVADGISLIRKR